MGHKFAEIAFTPTVREVQATHGSRSAYRAMEQQGDYNHRLSAREAAFIGDRDSFYMASVSETGWPYLQHRGGPTGFMRVLDERTIAFADFSGNRQYVSTGNFMNDDRVALFFMDYPNRTRLKLLGRVRIVDMAEYELLARLEVDDYRAQVERGFLIEVEAFDWNCPQHITPRHTENEVTALLTPLLEENRQLKAQTRPSRAESGTLGDGPLALVVSGVRQLTPRVRAFELRHPEGGELPPVAAGAHLQVPVRLNSGKLELRHYSICSNPARRDIYEIAALLEEVGNGGSRAVHESYGIGTRLHCEMPQNHFPLHTDERPAVLIAGGIGITPIKAMAQALQERGTNLQLHYAGRAYTEMAFCDRLERELGDRLTSYSAEQQQRLDAEALLQSAPEDAVIYICGPSRLIDGVTGAAERLGIDAERVRFERFDATVSASAKPVQVELRSSGRVIAVDAQQTLLDALLEEGVALPFGCKAGNCKSCAVKVVAGEPDHRDSALSATERSDNHLMCPCVSRAKSDRLVLDL